MPDHVHMMIATPPKYAVSQVVGFIKVKSAIHLARTYGERSRNFVGQHFWARGYFPALLGDCYSIRSSPCCFRIYVQTTSSPNSTVDMKQPLGPDTDCDTLLFGGLLCILVKTRRSITSTAV